MHPVNNSHDPLLTRDMSSADLRTLEKPHTLDPEKLLRKLETSVHGLTHAEVTHRLTTYGKNTLPKSSPPSVISVFLRQFKSPLIYVLLAAVILSLVIQEWSDAGFICAVLLINAIIGTIQEYSAQQAASALNKLVTTQCRVQRAGDTDQINADELVPGDIILLESGDRVPADIRLLTSHDLEIDESLLTGESNNVLKNPDTILKVETILAERINMTFAGTMVNRGRASGVVVNTGLNTELGHIAKTVLAKAPAKAPLLIRMEKFTHRVAIIVGVAALIMAFITLLQGTPLNEIFLLTVALAVSAIPEGLPVALTVALAIGMHKMAKRNVIVRRLVAVEALGSCTYIASDKTGTLTINQLTSRCIALPTAETWEITGESATPEGKISPPQGHLSAKQETLLQRLCLAAVLPNEGFLGHQQQGWAQYGDAVDVALLVMAHKVGITKTESLNAWPEIATIPFESEHLFAASLNTHKDKKYTFVKGALEQVLPMCTSMATAEGDTEINKTKIESQADKLAAQGYRILALAAGEVTIEIDSDFTRRDLKQLTFLGLVGMIDPIRPEAKYAVAACRSAGIQVAMITGDHPTTAKTIAQELSICKENDQVITGSQLAKAKDNIELEQLIKGTHVFARIEPRQKLDIVQSLQRSGHFVAVSGDGANDAPALRAAHVGVAMGKAGTDVARETADIIITDDNFSSIVAGIEEGRVAYANVRKVIFLLISTGAAELVLFTLALLTGQPLPLVAVQLLWLNLVTNGIQDIALAFEPAEGNELKQPPRSPKEPIFDRLMINRVCISALTIGIVSFLLFQLLLNQGYSIEEARNGTLLLMVLFENAHVFNSRSETLSIFLHSPLRNPILLFGTLTAQLIHIAAMYTPWIKDVLQIQPVSFENWLKLLMLAMSVIIVMELHKLFLSKIYRT